VGDGFEVAAIGMRWGVARHRISRCSEGRELFGGWVNPQIILTTLNFAIPWINAVLFHFPINRAKM
jgi:hypothetical protein